MNLGEFLKTCPICKQGKEFRFIRDFKKKQDKFSLYECSQCLVQFWLPLSVPGAKWYEQRSFSIVKPKIKRAYHKRFLKQDFSKNTRILDLGCGTGEFINEVNKKGCEVWGVDFDTRAIKFAKERFGLKNVYSLSFEEFFKKQDLPKFDIITFFEVIEHLDNPLEFIQNVKTLLKPGGRIVLSTPCRERMLLNLNTWDFPPHHFTRWNKQAISNLFQDFNISWIDYVEQFRILSESITGKFKTGLVNRASSIKKSKILYFLGKLKSHVIGTIPAGILWVFGKIFRRNNGIMFIELSKTKKLMFFIPTLTVGGGERVVSELSMNLPDSVETSIVLFKNQVSYPCKGKLICLNLPISNSFVLRIYYFLTGLSRFRKVLKEENPDYVISFSKPANIINALSNKNTVLRIDNFMSSACHGIYKVLIKFLYNKTDKIICVSKAAANDLIKNFKIKQEKIKVIYNPLNIKQIETLALEPLELEHREIFKKPVIISMGRLSKQKSQHYLIRAFSQVKKEIGQARLVILGKGELETELKELVKGLGLEHSVHFLGWQDNPFKFLSKSNIFALSSLWEGLPYVILEAMACGLPIVSVDCKSGPREILAPGTDVENTAQDIEYAQYGILTPPFKQEILSKAIIEILNNQQLLAKLGDKSKQRAKDFDIKQIIKQWNFLRY